MNFFCYSITVLVFCSMLSCSRDSSDKETDKEKTVQLVSKTAEVAKDAALTIHPEIWPQQLSPVERDEQTEKAIADILSRMTLEEKVGQIIQGDIASTAPEDVRKYNLGSILNGGNSAPGGDNRASPDKWLALADEFWKASTDNSDGGVGIPAIWGTDAVHGHSNIIGATLFPHNIGLGAANDPSLMHEIGRITALEILVTGLDWTFAPTIAVVRDDRWGRTYESYSEDPAIVKAYAGKLITGIQGEVGKDSYFDEDHLLATAKHFVGDGGTVGGRDQGDNRSTEEALRDIQGAGYPVAIAHGAQSVMASFNSWHGKKMHGYRALLNDVLVEQMGLDGFVVGDWNGHGQVSGCTNTSCARSFNSGLDMFMASDSWQGLYYNTLAQVRSGEISAARLDQAVKRILRVKHRVGLFDAGLPSSRKHAGQYQLLASPEHKSVAREAVRKSLVLLKNQNQLLPLSPKLKVLVAGDGANNIRKQAGGWTLTWQGTDNKNEHFPQGTSIYYGIKQHVDAAGGSAILSENGDYKDKPDVAIVVFGEEPYAEFQGDRAHLDFESEAGLHLLKKYKDAGIATVAIFISGRPMWVNPEINAAQAFVAAWLPGSEGGGVADVLFRKPDESIAYDFVGKLSFSWPKTAMQTGVNVGDSHYDPLFPYGYGLRYADNIRVEAFAEDPELDASLIGNEQYFLRAGDAVPPWRLVISDAGGRLHVNSATALSPKAALSMKAQDRNAQEDSSLLDWRDSATVSIEGESVDFLRSGLPLEEIALEFEYSVIGGNIENTILSVACNKNCAGTIDITQHLQNKVGKGWQLSRLGMHCFANKLAELKDVRHPVKIASVGDLKFQISTIKLVNGAKNTACSL